MPAVFRDRVRTPLDPRADDAGGAGRRSASTSPTSATGTSSRSCRSSMGEHHKYDRELHLLDRALFFGHDPACVLHDAARHRRHRRTCCPTVYLWFLPLVPLALTAWLVWSRNLSYGYWFATSQCIAWTLGTLSYYALPTLGPGHRVPVRSTPTCPQHRRHAADGRSIQWTRQRAASTASSGVAAVGRRLRQPARRDHAAGRADGAVHDCACRWLKIVFWVNFCAHRRRHHLLRLALHRRRHRRGRDRPGLLLRRRLGQRPVVRPAPRAGRGRARRSYNRVVRQADTPGTSGNFVKVVPFVTPAH